MGVATPEGLGIGARERQEEKLACPANICLGRRRRTARREGRTRIRRRRRRRIRVLPLTHPAPPPKFGRPQAHARGERSRGPLSRPGSSSQTTLASHAPHRLTPCKCKGRRCTRLTAATNSEYSARKIKASTVREETARGGLRGQAAFAARRVRRGRPWRRRAGARARARLRGKVRRTPLLAEDRHRSVVPLSHPPLPGPRFVVVDACVVREAGRGLEQVWAWARPPRPSRPSRAGAAA